MYDPLTPSDCRASLRDLVPMIRDDLRTALGRALERAGLPEPPGGIDARSRPQPRPRRLGVERGAPAARASSARPPRDIAAADQGRARGRARFRTSPRSRSPGPGFLNLFLAPTWLHDVLRDGGRGRRAATAARRCSRAGASTSSSSRRIPPGRCTPAAGAGSRSATRSRTCSPRRAPRCTASTT